MKPIFENAYDIFYEYAKERFKIVKELGDFFIIRRVGRTLRLHFAIDDLIDWWDYDIEPEILENWLKGEVYTKAVFKWLPENSKFKKTLESLPMKPQKIEYSKVYYINLEEIHNEEKLLKSLSRNRRKDIKKKIKRLNNTGNWDVLLLNLGEIWDEMIEFINQRFKKSPFNDKKFSETVKKFLENRYKDVWTLRLNGENIAYSVVLCNGNIAYWYLTAFNTGYSFFSPSEVLLYKMILHYQSAGFKEFNFMKGESQYKEWWAKSYKKIYKYEYLNPSIFKRVISILIGGINPG